MNSDAGKLMEEYIESGSYKHLKELSYERDAIQKNIYNQLINHETKRHEIGYNLVAKFIKKKIFQYDYAGLNEYLYDRGLLQHLTRLSSNMIKEQKDLLDLFAPYQMKPKYYIKPSFNKVGRELIGVEESQELNLDLKDAARKKRENLIALRKSKSEYESLKKQIAKCNNFLYEKKIKHKYGSLSYIQKPINYDIKQLTDESAIKALIEFGRPGIDKLELYMIKGFISKSELESFRKLIDIKLEFTILDLDEEATMLNYIDKCRN